MQNSTKQKLKVFAKNDVWQGLLPSDMNIFYEFVIEAYKNGDKEISEDELLEVVNPFHKMYDDEIEKFVGKFECSIGLLNFLNFKDEKNY